MIVWSLFYILLLCVLFIMCSVGTGLRPFLPSVTSSWCLEAAAHSTTAASHPPGKLLPTYCWPRRSSPRRDLQQGEPYQRDPGQEDAGQGRGGRGGDEHVRGQPDRLWGSCWGPRCLHLHPRRLLGRRVFRLLIAGEILSKPLFRSKGRKSMKSFYQFSKSILCLSLESLACSEDEWGVFFTNPRYT